MVQLAAQHTAPVAFVTPAGETFDFERDPIVVVQTAVPTAKATRNAKLLLVLLIGALLFTVPATVHGSSAGDASTAQVAASR